jgi:hypothetical protein
MYTRDSGSTRTDQQQGGTVGKTTERRWTPSGFIAVSVLMPLSFANALFKP